MEFEASPSVIKVAERSREQLQIRACCARGTFFELAWKIGFRKELPIITAHERGSFTPLIPSVSELN